MTLRAAFAAAFPAALPAAICAAFPVAIRAALPVALPSHAIRAAFSADVIYNIYYIIYTIYYIIYNIYYVICNIGYVAPRGRGQHPKGDNSGRGLQGRRALIKRASAPAPGTPFPAQLYYRGLKTTIGESPGTRVELGAKI